MWCGRARKEDGAGIGLDGGGDGVKWGYRWLKGGKGMSPMHCASPLQTQTNTKKGDLRKAALVKSSQQVSSTS